VTGGEDLAENDFVDFRTFDLGAFQRRFDGDGTQFVGRKRGQRTIEGTNGRACGTDDNNLGC